MTTQAPIWQGPKRRGQFLSTVDADYPQKRGCVVEDTVACIVVVLYSKVWLGRGKRQGTMLILAD